MKKEQQKHAGQRQRVKIVAEMPGDEKMREQMKEQQQNDGYPGSCGCDA